MSSKYWPLESAHEVWFSIFFFQNNQKCYSELIIIVPTFLKESVFIFLAFFEEKQSIKTASEGIFIKGSEIFSLYGVS